MDRLAGFHPVREALRARRRELLRLLQREGLRHSGLPEVLALAAAAGVPVETVTESVLVRGLPAGLRDQGLVLEAGPLPRPSLEELVAGTPSPRRLVVLDGVEDPQNLGDVARVAEASGAAGLIQASHGAARVGAVASRASAGALEHLPLVRVPNLARALRLLRDSGHWLIGADAGAQEDLFASPDRIWQGDLVLVFGAEGRGLRPAVARHLDHRLRIPLLGRVASLNVAGAAAIVLFEASRRANSPRG